MKSNRIFKKLQEYSFFVKAFLLWAFVSILWNTSLLTMQSLLENNSHQVHVKIFQIFVSLFSISIGKITKTLFFFNNNRSITHTPVLNTLKMKKNGLKIWNFGLEEYYLCQYLYWDSFQTLCHLLFSEKVMEMKFSRNFS